MAQPGFFARHQSVRSLQHRDFKLLLAASAVQSLLMPLQFITLIFWVQSEYPGRSVIYVSLVSAARGVGLLGFSLFGGAVADRFQRRHVLLACESAAFGLTGLTAALMLTRPLGDATVVAVLACTLVSAATLAIDMPARAASIPAVSGMSDLSNAISLNMVAAQVTFPLILPVTGALNSVFDPGQVFAGSLLGWCASLPLIGLLRFRSERGIARAGVIGNIGDGLVYTRSSAVLFGTIGAVAVVQIIGMPGIGSMGALWMTQVLGLSRTEFGFMAMTWGLGALAVSLTLARLEHVARRGLTLCVFVLVFAAAATVFGHSRNVPLSAAANLAAGGAFIGALMTANTIAQHFADEAMRGRVMGLFPLVMGMGMLNALPVGAVAQATSLALVLPILGWVTLGLALAIAAPAGGLRSARAHFVPVVVSRAPALSVEGATVGPVPAAATANE